MSGAGRPEKPLDPSAGPLPRFAHELRERRRREGLTYRALAEKSGLAVSTLRAAAAGEQLPTWRVARAFAMACGGDEQQVRVLWEQACAALGRPIPDRDPAPHADPPDPGLVTTPAQFLDHMKRLRVWAGSPSLADLNTRSGGFRLPPSTVSEALRRERLPRLELVSAYVRACGLDDVQVQQWEQAWVTLRSRELLPERVDVPDDDVEQLPDRATQPDLRVSRKRREWKATALAMALLLTFSILVAHWQISDPKTKLTTVRVAGNASFFEDPSVRAEFKRHGIDVKTTAFGSRAIADHADLSRYDIAFSASTAGASLVQQQISDRFHRQVPRVQVFSSPFVVLTWRPLIPLLQQLGLTTQEQDGTWTFDIGRYLQVTRRGTKWNEIPGNEIYQHPNQVQLEIPDPGVSDLGALFVAAASYALNGGQVVSDSAKASAIAARIVPAFKELGQLKSSSAQVFEDYLTYSMGAAPLVLGYESQFVRARLGSPPLLPPQAMIMYVKPSVISDHTMLPLTENGNMVADLLRKDSALQRLAQTTFGYRSATLDYTKDMASRGIQVPATLFTINTPSEPIMKDLIAAVQAELSRSR